MARTLRVGIVGANATGGWARESHVPAVQQLNGLELAAVATNSQRTADEAARTFGVPKGYGSGDALIRDPEIDLVTVATRVPDHRNLVMSAIAAGKHVYCEWPLGRGLGETEEMTLAARKKGAHTAIGLQLRASPAVLRARDLITSGAIGRLLSINVISPTAGFGAKVADPFQYLEDPDNFANLMTIQGAHTIDLVAALGGGIDSLSALATAQFPEISAGHDGERRKRRTFDHLLVQGTLSNNATFSIEVAGGRPIDARFRLEAIGESGELRLEGGAPRGAQSSALSVSVNDGDGGYPDGASGNLPDTAVNVTGVYARLRDDILNDTNTSIGFDHALALTRLIDDLFESSQTGARKSMGDGSSTADKLTQFQR